MKLTQTQKNFRKQMGELKKSGYKQEDEIYAPVRKKSFVKSTIGIGSVIGIVIILWNVIALFQTANNSITSFTQRGISTYINEINILDSETSYMVNDMINTVQKTRNTNESITKLIQYEMKFNEINKKMHEIKIPKKLETYHAYKIERYQKVFLLIYELKSGVQMNSYNPQQINNLIHEINALSKLEQDTISTVLNETGINYY